MSLRSLALIAVVVLAAAWWYLSDDPETRVRNAHLELVGVFNKADGDTGTLSLLQIQAIRALFADTCVVSGDAGAQGGRFSPEEMARSIVSLRQAFRSIELTSTEPTIAFPADDEAVSEFSATLVAAGGNFDPGEIAYTRHVTSRMRNVDGEWLFAEIHLTESAATE